MMLRHVLITALVILSCAASVRADDTEIYGTVTNPPLEPNVLIIFDTSGSMATEDVPGDPYDKNLELQRLLRQPRGLPAHLELVPLSLGLEFDSPLLSTTSSASTIKDEL